MKLSILFGVFLAVFMVFTVPTEATRDAQPSPWRYYGPPPRKLTQPMLYDGLRRTPSTRNA